MKKICVVCGKEFDNSHKKVKCCSRDCSNELKKINKYNKMCDKVNEDFETWLRRKYEDEKLTIREISILLYGNNKNSHYILDCLKRFNINIRHGSEAIKTQYIGEKGEKRKEQAKVIANEVLQNEEVRNKIREIMQTEDYKRKQSISKSGENNGSYNPNLTDEEREKGRNIEGYKEWRKQVYERDNYTCQCCGEKGHGNLVAHHKNGYHWDKEHRTDVDNGVTLCEDCHKEFHEIFGNKNNTEEQYIEFLLSRYLGDVI